MLFEGEASAENGVLGEVIVPEGLDDKVDSEIMRPETVLITVLALEYVGQVLGPRRYPYKVSAWTPS